MSITIHRHHETFIDIHGLDIQNQWTFQEPKLEVPTLYLCIYIYIRPIFQGLSARNMAKHMVYTNVASHLLDPEDLPLTKDPIDRIMEHPTDIHR